MKCDVCKESQATVHLTRIINGKMQKVDLCEACAKQKGVSEAVGFSLTDLLPGLEAESSPPSQVTTPAEIRCLACDMTQSDFKKAGRLGCPKCYDTFAEGLLPLLKGMHKGDHHVGKIPASMQQADLHRAKIQKLKHELQSAVKNESFEEAARLRDEIRKLDQSHPC